MQIRLLCNTLILCLTAAVSTTVAQTSPCANKDESGLPLPSSFLPARLPEFQAQLKSFLDANSDRIAAVRSPYGTTSFPRLPQGSVDKLLHRLRTKFETTVVPGKFFEMPDHFRLGIGGPTEVLAKGLERMTDALNESF